MRGVVFHLTPWSAKRTRKLTVKRMASSLIALAIGIHVDKRPATVFYLLPSDLYTPLTNIILHIYEKDVRRKPDDNFPSDETTSTDQC